MNLRGLFPKNLQIDPPPPPPPLPPPPLQLRTKEYINYRGSSDSTETQVLLKRFYVILTKTV